MKILKFIGINLLAWAVVIALIYVIWTYPIEFIKTVAAGVVLFISILLTLAGWNKDPDKYNNQKNNK